MKLFSERRESTITLEDLARKCAMKYGVSIESCEKYARMLKRTAIECLVDGLSIKVSGLGTFVVHKKDSKYAHCNFGAEKKIVHIPEKHIVKFIPSDGLNERIDYNQKIRQ